MKKIVKCMLLVMLLGLTGCVVPKKETVSSSEPVASSSSTSESTEEMAPPPSPDVPVQVVGSDEYGYLEIPEDWIDFHDLAGGDSIQYTDGSAVNIITLNAYDLEKFGATNPDELTAENVANSYAYGVEQMPQLDQTWGAMSQVSGYEAFQVNAIMDNGTILSAWIFQPEPERVVLISMEGEEKAVLDMISYIEHTWRAQK